MRVLGKCRHNALCSQPMGVLRKAGSCPNRAMKVMREMTRMPMRILRTTDMLGHSGLAYHLESIDRNAVFVI